MVNQLDLLKEGISADANENTEKGAQENVESEEVEVVNPIEEPKEPEIKPEPPIPTSKDYPKWKDRYERNWATVPQLRKVCDLRKISVVEFEYITNEDL